MLVSFIIPAFNAEDTIERCLNSIYALSLKREEFEVIVIDDASSDNTIDVIENWRLKIENLKLLRQSENHRQGAARNRGVKIAKGEYMCFVDSDDAVTEGIVTAIQMAKEKEADMVALHYGNANERGEMTSEAERLSFEEGKIFTGIEMQNKHPYWCAAPWGYVYRRSFLQNINYPFAEDVLYEDTDFVTTHLYCAQRMVYSQDPGYRAYYRGDSTTHSRNYKNAADYLLLAKRMLALYNIVNRDVERGFPIDDSVRRFADSILEGACWNVQKACLRLYKLKGIDEVRKFYGRIDVFINRRELAADKRIQRYYWNAWTSICLRHEHIAIMLASCLIPIYHFLKKMKA